jgi:hypothetical protein
MKLTFRLLILCLLCLIARTTKLYSYLNNYNTYRNGYQAGNQFLAYGMNRNTIYDPKTGLWIPDAPQGPGQIPQAGALPQTLGAFPQTPGTMPPLPGVPPQSTPIPGFQNVGQMPPLPNVPITSTPSVMSPLPGVPINAIPTSMPPSPPLPAGTPFTPVGTPLNGTTGNTNVFGSVNPSTATITPNQLAPNGLPNSPTPQAPVSNPDEIFYKTITDNILEIAGRYNKSSPLKKKQNGVLPDGALKQNREAALKQREDRTIWNPILSLPTKLYKYCIYPPSKVGYPRFCKNSYLTFPEKMSSCQYSFCQVCCDHLGYIFEYGANTSKVAEALKLKDQQGLNGMKQLIDHATIDACKTECKVIYY